MEKRKNVIGLLFLSFIIFSLIFTSVLVIAQNTSGEGLKVIAGSFSNFFSKTGWTAGNMEPNVAKIFFFIMVALVVYLIIGSLFPNQQVIMLILSAVISFLATAYIAPDEVYSILISYTALGLTITTLVPLAILMGLTYRATSATKGQVQLIMLQWLAWVLFAVYSLYRFIYDWGWGKEGSATMNGIILATTILAACFAVFNKQITRMIMKRFTESQTEAAEQMLTEVWDTRRAEREAARRATGA